MNEIKQTNASAATTAQKSADEFTKLMEESFGVEETKEMNAHYEQKEPGCTTGFTA